MDEHNTRKSHEATEPGSRYAEIVRQYACCSQAHVRACVCAYSFECPIHGVTHVGSHD